MSAATTAVMINVRPALS